MLTRLKQRLLFLVERALVRGAGAPGRHRRRDRRRLLAGRRFLLAAEDEIVVLTTYE